MAEMELDEYFNETEFAVKHLYSGLAQCWRFYQRAVEYWDMSRIGLPLTPEEKERIDGWFSDPIAKSETAHIRPGPQRFEELRIEKDRYGMDAEAQWVEYLSARKAFDEYLGERIGKEKLKLRKGHKRLAVVQFNDNTKWEIPRELHVTLRE
jgi:hypothetical protein